MKTFRITYKDSEGNQQTINITANSEEEARDKFTGQFPNASVDTLETSLFNEPAEGAGGALRREQIDEERALGGIFQRGFLEGLGIDPDAPVQGATSRFFRDFAPVGQNILRFGSLMNPETFENVDEEGQLNRMRLGDLARNLGASIGTGPQGILGRARSTFSDLQNLARQGAPTSTGVSFPKVMDALNPYFQATSADEGGADRMRNLYSLGAGAALDKYGRFLGSDLIPRESTVAGRFASAPQEQREAGFFDFLQRQLGLN